MHGDRASTPRFSASWIAGVAKSTSQVTSRTSAPWLSIRSIAADFVWSGSSCVSITLISIGRPSTPPAAFSVSASSCAAARAGPSKGAMPPVRSMAAPITIGSPVGSAAPPVSAGGSAVSAGGSAAGSAGAGSAGAGSAGGAASSSPPPHAAAARPSASTRTPKTIHLLPLIPSPPSSGSAPSGRASLHRVFIADQRDAHKVAVSSAAAERRCGRQARPRSRNAAVRPQP